MPRPPANSLTSDQLLTAIVEHDNALRQTAIGSFTLLPVPTRRERKACWVITSVHLVDTDAGEKMGPVIGTRLVPADGGLPRDVRYRGPHVAPFLVSDHQRGTKETRERLRVSITVAAVSFFERRHASRSAWMQVALHGEYPGPMWKALKAVAPDFLAWLAAAPDDRAEAS